MCFQSWRSPQCLVCPPLLGPQLTLAASSLPCGSGISSASPLGPWVTQICRGISEHQRKELHPKASAHPSASLSQVSPGRGFVGGFRLNIAATFAAWSDTEKPQGIPTISFMYRMLLLIQGQSCYFATEGVINVLRLILLKPNQYWEVYCVGLVLNNNYCNISNNMSNYIMIKKGKLLNRDLSSSREIPKCFNDWSTQNIIWLQRMSVPKEGKNRTSGPSLHTTGSEQSHCCQLSCEHQTAATLQWSGTIVLLGGNDEVITENTFLGTATGMGASVHHCTAGLVGASLLRRQRPELPSASSCPLRDLTRGCWRRTLQQESQDHWIPVWFGLEGSLKLIQIQPLPNRTIPWSYDISVSVIAKAKPQSPQTQFNIPSMHPGALICPQLKKHHHLHPQTPSSCSSLLSSQKEEGRAH